MSYMKNSRRVVCLRRTRSLTLCDHHHFDDDRTTTTDESRVTCPKCRRLLRWRDEQVRQARLRAIRRMMEGT